MTGFRPFMARLLNGSKKPAFLEKKVAHELDPRPPGCDCGLPADEMVPDEHDGHSWVCPCGLRY